MKKGTFFSIVALLVSIVGITVAVAAYMKRRNCVLCDDIDEDMFMDDDCDCCGCDDECCEDCETDEANEDCGCSCQVKEEDSDTCTDSSCCCEHSEDAKAE